MQIMHMVCHAHILFSLSLCMVFHLFFHSSFSLFLSLFYSLTRAFLLHILFFFPFHFFHLSPSLPVSFPPFIFSSLYLTLPLSNPPFCPMFLLYYFFLPHHNLILSLVESNLSVFLSWLPMLRQVLVNP